MELFATMCPSWSLKLFSQHKLHLTSVMNVSLLKDALSENMKILFIKSLVTVSLYLVQGFWLHLKLAFLVKTKAKIDQMN